MVAFRSASTSRLMPGMPTLKSMWRKRFVSSSIGRIHEEPDQGEIRICIEAGLPLSYLWRRATARDRAIALFGKLGVARNTNEVTTTGFASVNGDKDKTALYASVGAEYAVNKNVKVSLEYENYGKNDIDTGRKSGAVTAGVRYAF